MNRRNFLRVGSAGVAASVLMDIGAANAPTGVDSTCAAKQIGIQLYSLRDDMSKDPEGTLREVAKMGYKHVETYGYGEGKFFGKSPKEFSGFLAGIGLRMSSSHTGFPVYADPSEAKWDAVKRNMEDTKAAGAKWIVQAGYPGSTFTKMDQVRQLADTFNMVGELAKTFGLKFAYHNHRKEYRAVEDRIPYQQYLELTDPGLMSFQNDIGHTANEMADYLIYLIKYPGRFGCLHIRDTNIVTKRATEMGTGDVRLKEVFDLFANAGVEDYYVEQEEYNFTPLESLKKCYDYLNKAPFVKW